MIWLGLGIGFLIGVIAGFFICYGVVVHLCNIEENSSKK